MVMFPGPGTAPSASDQRHSVNVMLAPHLITRDGTNPEVKCQVLIFASML